MTLGWNLKDLRPPNATAPRVLSTFACGGGSSMGYKLAGCRVIAANDIDPKMAWHYETNLKPPHMLVCPIQELITRTLPFPIDEIDILDGSPPCSVFSMCGNREDDWNKNRHFQEGQAKQILSDLFFDFITLAERVQPKVIVAENVKGMIMGRAKGYAKEVVLRLNRLGYEVQVFLLNAAECGVPQSRERVFFVARKKSLNLKQLVLRLDSSVPTVRQALADVVVEAEVHQAPPCVRSLYSLSKSTKSDAIAATRRRLNGGNAFFSWRRCAWDQPACTITAMAAQLHPDEPRSFTPREIVRLGSFPDDYVFANKKTPKSQATLAQYIVGMSVPPRMMERVAEAIKQQWFQ
jgi:DNA (cytosine-5)-methyltransferase 1